MKRLKLGLRSATVMGVVLLAVVASAAFVGTRTLRDGDQVAADESDSEQVRALLDEDQRLTRFDGEINGIRLGPDVDDRAIVVCAGEAALVEFSEVRGDSLDVEPPYLPEGAVRKHELIASCDGEIISAEATYFLEASNHHPYGARILIYRYKGEPAFRADYPVARVSDESTLARPAILVRPVADDGLGNSAIFLRDDHGLTTIRAAGITAAELLRIAESLYMERSQ